MDIRLNARLSAYNKIPTPVPECEADVVTNEDIDSLFNTTETPQIMTIPKKKTNNGDVSFSDIDSLFN